MPSDTNAGGAPPLVSRVEPPVEVHRLPAKPRPGFLEAVLWCLAFLGTQILAALFTTGAVLTVFAIQSGNAGQFITDQLNGLGHATTLSEPEGGRPAVPTGIGQSLAYGMLAAQVAALVLIVAVVPWRIGPGWQRQIGVRRPAAMHLLLVLLLVPGFMILSGGAQELIAAVTGVRQPPANKALNGTFRQVPWFVTFLAVALGPGFVEEVWCRGFLGRGLCARYGLIAGVGLTSALFGLLHVDPAYAVVTACMGAYLHFVFLATRSIWVPIFLHVVNNGLAILISLTQVGPAELDAEAKQLQPIYYLVSFSLILFASVGLWTSRVAIHSGTGGVDDWWNAPGWRPEYPGISTPPPGAVPELVLAHARISPAAVMLTFASLAALLYLLGR